MRTRVQLWKACAVPLLQANYQMMDSGFVGLIFSAFNEVSTLCTSRVRCILAFLESPSLLAVSVIAMLAIFR